jgi:hypothetical protein
MIPVHSSPKRKVVHTPTDTRRARGTLKSRQNLGLRGRRRDWDGTNGMGGGMLFFHEPLLVLQPPPPCCLVRLDVAGRDETRQDKSRGGKSLRHLYFFFVWPDKRKSKKVKKCFCPEKSVVAVLSLWNYSTGC